MTDRDLFIAALDHADPVERDLWLDQACGGDAEHRRRVNVLLRAYVDASRFLAEPVAPPVSSDDPTRTAHPGDRTFAAADFDVRALLAPADKPGLLGRLKHYEVLEVVGSGGMGVVVKAFDPKLHRVVAIKLMAPHLAAHAAARRRFEREARAVAAVRNEHVVAIHDVETDGPTPYLVMEFVGGSSLQDRLERRGPFAVNEILRIGMQAARGLHAAHQQGLVHRDIKPANILLENGVERVRITDFGLARAVDDASLTQSGVVTGTPNYMSPEQAAGLAIDARSDLFSLGSVLYALCAGHPPFRAETPLAVLRRVCDDPVRPPREVNADIPDWLDAIVRKLLAKAPTDRFQTATEVAELLGQHLAHLQHPTATPRPAPVILAEATRQPEPVWHELLNVIDRRKRLAQHGLFLGGFALSALTVVLLIAGTRDVPILFAPGLGLVVASALVRQRWEVAYKGRTLRFENSIFTGEKLFIDATQIARGGFGMVRELRGRIPVGAGGGDQVRCLVHARVFQLTCRIEVCEGDATVPTPPAESAPALAPLSVLPNPTAPRPSPLGCWVVMAFLVGLVLLVAFRDAIWNNFFRAGYFAPFYMFGVSGIMLFVEQWGREKANPGWDRRRWNIAIAVTIGSTIAALVVCWLDLRHMQSVSRAINLHTCGMLLSTLIVNLPSLARWLGLLKTSGALPDRETGPRPSRERQTGWTLLGGLLALASGFIASLLCRNLDLPDDRLARVQAFVMGLWIALAIVCFGPGVFVAREGWRKRHPNQRRGDRRATLLSVLGIVTTLTAACVIVHITPVLQHELFG